MNSGVIVGILVLFYVAGVVVVATGVEAPSEAWCHCTMCRVSQLSLRRRILHDAIGGHCKAFGYASYDTTLEK